MKLILKTILLINIIFSFSLFSQNVTVQYSKKEYPFKIKDDVPTINYRLRVTDNGNVLSVTSIDKKILQYIYLDSLGNEIYAGQIEALKYPRITKELTDFVVQKNKLVCYTQMKDPETKLYSIFSIGIDMKLNKVLYEKVLAADGPEKTFVLRLTGNTLNESVYIVERLKIGDTKYKMSFSHLDINSNIIETEKVELDNKMDHYYLIPNKGFIGYRIEFDAENPKSTASKIELFKYEFKTKIVTKSELNLNFPIIRYYKQNYFYKKDDNKINFEGLDFTTKTKGTIDGYEKTYHTFALLAINVDDIKATKINYYEPDKINEYVINNTESKKEFSNYFIYSSLLLKDNTIATIILDDILSMSAKKFGAFTLNSKYELTKSGHYIFKPEKKLPKYFDIAASRSDKGYYLIDVGYLNDDELKDKSQKKQDYLLIYNVNGSIVTRETISENRENKIENSFLKGGIFSYSLTYRDNNVSYDCNKSKDIFCYLLKNEKAGTYKCVWLFFK